jgi:hypothetical protein
MTLAMGAASTIIAVAGLAGCSGAGNGGVVNMDASWAVEYHTLHDLKAHATVAVQGSFTGVIAQTTDDKGIPYTDFEFTVDQVLNDPGHLVTPGAKLVIHQTGGTVNGQVHQIGDDPLFQVSESCVLFLNQFQPGHFFVIGGPTGRFEIKKGTVSPHDPKGAPFSGSPAEFATAVQNA